MQELEALARASCKRNALRHVWASPPDGVEWNSRNRALYWHIYDNVMGLQGRPVVCRLHDKDHADGTSRTTHEHRVYLALDDRGRHIRIDHDFSKQEAVSRIFEFEMGLPLIKGAHNIRARGVLQQLGRDDVIAAMEEAGLFQGMRAHSALSPKQRRIQARTSVDRRDVGQAALEAFRAARDPSDFRAKLEARGLLLAIGTRTPVVVDRAGSAHALRTLLSETSMRAGGPGISGKQVAAAIEGLQLLTDRAARKLLSGLPAPASAPREEMGAYRLLEAVTPVQAAPPASREAHGFDENRPWHEQPKVWRALFRAARKDVYRYWRHGLDPTGGLSPAEVRHVVAIAGKRIGVLEHNDTVAAACHRLCALRFGSRRLPPGELMEIEREKAAGRSPFPSYAETEIRVADARSALGKPVCQVGELNSRSPALWRPATEAAHFARVQAQAHQAALSVTYVHMGK